LIFKKPLNSFFNIFPVAVIGREATNSFHGGIYTQPYYFLHILLTHLPLRIFPSFSITKAFISSPSFSSGMPITAVRGKQLHAGLTPLQFL
jgi:hypothetical protein